MSKWSNSFLEVLFLKFLEKKNFLFSFFLKEGSPLWISKKMILLAFEFIFYMSLVSF